MKISEQIEQIIAARHKHLPEISQELKKLEEIEELMNQLDDMKSQMISQEGSFIEGGKYALLLEQNPDMAWHLQSVDTSASRVVMADARRALGECLCRFGRKSISISVIGEARRGKSALLKSISGLNDLIIPAFESTDCTGAPSVIYNSQEEGVKAVLKFKSRRQMADMAQVYLDKLIPEPEERILVSHMEQIRTLDMDAILQKVPLGHPGLIVQSYLKKLIEHYDEWASYAGRTEPLILREEEEIAAFVAQNNGVPVGEPGRIEYYKYLVVEKCEIYCSFPELEAGRINLIDTVGLGDHTEGILEGMLHTVEKESDAVIFMILPQNGAGGGIPQSVVEIYRQIVEKCQNRDLSKWLFYLINHVETAKGSYAQNIQFCNSAAKMLKESKFLGCEHTWIINVLDAESVRKNFLGPMLTELFCNLAELDGIYIRQANTVLKALQMEYGQLCKRAQKVLQSDFIHDSTLFPLINGKTEEGLRAMRGALFQLTAKWAAKKSQPCSVIYDAAGRILSRMQQDYVEDSYIPRKEEIQELLEGGAQPHQIYIDYENQIRNAVSKDFLNVDTELKDFVNCLKDEIAEVLYGQCGFANVLKPGAGRPAREWLKDFSDSVLDDSSYPNIKLAVDTLYRFDFSVKGFLTYEVRDGLNGLDPSFSNVPAIVNSQNNLRRTAANIQTSLLSRLCSIAGELGDRLETLFCKPNMALAAEASEFYDRMIYAENVEMEWRNFYAEKASVLWMTDIRQKQAVNVLCQDWMDLVNEMAEKNMVSSFVLQSEDKMI